MENINELRKFVLSSIMELYQKQSAEENENIAKLKEATKSDSQRVYEILDTLNPDDSTFVKDYINKRVELEYERMDYIFEKGIMLGYKLSTDPLSILFENKNAHSVQ